MPPPVVRPGAACLAGALTPPGVFRFTATSFLRSSFMGFAQPHSLLLCSCEMELTGFYAGLAAVTGQIGLGFLSYSLNLTFFFF